MMLLVLGGTRFLSREVATQAVARGWDVTCACRGESGTAAGRRTPPGLGPRRRAHPPRSATAAGTPSSTSHDCPPTSGGRWPRRPTPTGSSSRPSASTPTTPRPPWQPLVEPITDDVDLAVDPEAYGGMKVACEQVVQSGAASSAIVRPGLIVGPGDPTGRFAHWPQRLARGGEVLAPGRPEDVVQVIDVRDLATWLLDLARVADDRGLRRGRHRRCRWASCWPAWPPGVGRADPELTWVDAEFLEAQGVTPGPARARSRCGCRARSTTACWRTTPARPSRPGCGCDRSRRPRRTASTPPSWRSPPEREAEVLAAWHAR